MLSKKFRFQGLGSVRPAMRHGRTTRGAGFTLKSLKNSKRQASRLSIVVSAKVSKSAVKRNRIRRRLYELGRHNWEKIKPGYDIVVIVHQAELAQYSQKELTSQLLDALQKAELLER